MVLAHIGTVHERKSPVGKINNDFSSIFLRRNLTLDNDISSLNKHIYIYPLMLHGVLRCCLYFSLMTVSVQV